MKDSIPFADPSLGPIESNVLLEVTKQKNLTNGYQCNLFQQEFDNFIEARKYDHRCTTVSSCTAALHMAYMAMGIGPGDEVIVPALTHVSTAHAVEITGAKPIFVDSCRANGNIDSYRIEKAITDRTKAICVVHFLGQAVNMHEVNKIAKEYSLYVVEDCALALDSMLYTQHVGTFADFSAFSFYPCKHITTGDGGMLIYKTKYNSIVQSLKQFGKEKEGDFYNIKRVGLNYRMNEFTAAVGRVQLQKYIKENWEEKRNNNANILKQKIKHGIFDGKIDDNICVLNNNGNYAVSIIFAGFYDSMGNNKRNKYLNLFIQRGIGVSVYYPKPVPYFDYYRNKYPCHHAKYKNAKFISDCSITLPVGPHIDDKAISQIIDVLIEGNK